MTHAMRELLLPQTTILTPNSIEVRLLAEGEDDDDAHARAVRGEARSRRAASTCSSPARTRTRREVVNTLYGKSGVVRTDNWPRLPGSYHGVGLHARLGDRRHARQRPRPVRCGARGAGIHVAGAAQGVSARAWDSSCPTACSGRARRPRRAATRPEAPRGRCAMQPLTVRRALRGLYAVTPDEADTARLCAMVECGDRTAARARCSIATRRRRRRCVASRRGRSRSSAASAARSSSSTTTPRSPARSMPTACTSARTTARSPQRARSVRREARRRRVVLRRSARARRARRATAPTTSRSAASFPSRVKPDARRADVSLIRGARSRSACPSSPSAASPRRMRRLLVDAGVDAVAVISGVFAHDDLADDHRAAAALAALLRS